METELRDIVMQLATWVGDVAPEVWAIMLKQVMVKGWQNVFGAVLGLVGLVGGVLMLVRGYKIDNDEDSYTDGFTWSMIGCICAVLAVLAIVACSLQAISCFVNPEYQALMQLKNMFH